MKICREILENIFEVFLKKESAHRENKDRCSKLTNQQKWIHYIASYSH